MQPMMMLDAPHHRPVFMPAMPNVHALAAFHADAPRARMVAIATITTTGTTGTGVRTRVQD